jgi:hypothetical protein
MDHSSLSALAIDMIDLGDKVTVSQRRKEDVVEKYRQDANEAVLTSSGETIIRMIDSRVSCACQKRRNEFMYTIKLKQW